MPNERYEADGVPERLRQITIETLPVERPYVIDIEPFVEPQEVMYTDRTSSPPLQHNIKHVKHKVCTKIR